MNMAIVKPCNICARNFQPSNPNVTVCNDCGASLIYRDRSVATSAVAMTQNKAQSAVVLDHELRERFSTEFLPAAPGLFIVTYDPDANTVDEEPLLGWLVSRQEDTPCIPVTPGGAWHTAPVYGVQYPDGRMYIPPVAGMHDEEEGDALLKRLTIGGGV